MYSYSQGTLVRPRDTRYDNERRSTSEREERIFLKGQMGRSVYRIRHPAEEEMIRDRRVVRSISNPTYVSRPVRYVKQRPLTSSYSSETGSTTLKRSDSSSSFTDTSETSSTGTTTDTISSRDYKKPITVRRRYLGRRQSVDSIEGYEARQFRSKEPGSWRIIKKPANIRYVEEERLNREPEYTTIRKIVQPEYAEVRKEREIGRRAPIRDREIVEYRDPELESSTYTSTPDTESDNVIIERYFRNRMRTYQSRHSRDVATQMITHIVPPKEKPKSTNTVVTQTEEQSVCPQKLPRNRYKTAVIQAEPVQQPNTDDEIEIVVMQDPGLTKEVVRKPEPPPILVEEIDLRPPPPAPIANKDFGPKRKYVPPPPVS